MEAASEDDAYRQTAVKFYDEAGMRAEMERKQLLPKHETAQAGGIRAAAAIEDRMGDIRACPFTKHER